MGLLRGNSLRFAQSPACRAKATVPFWEPHKDLGGDTAALATEASRIGTV